MPTIIAGKKKQTTGTGAATRLATAHMRARINGTPPGNSVGAEYENLDKPESDYFIDGEFRKPLPSPKYDVENWKYDDRQEGNMIRTTATRWYLKITHERSLIGPAAVMGARAASRKSPAKKSAAKKAAKRATTKKVAAKKVAGKKVAAKKSARKKRGSSR